jgi:hypothetical protein
MQKLSRKQRDQNVGLVDVVDRVLEKGAVVHGDIAIRLADIDLVYINLRLMVTSISKIAQLTDNRTDEQKRIMVEESLTADDIVYLNKLEEVIKQTEEAIPRTIDGTDAEKIEQGITRLVLTITELIRRIMEREAVRQVKMNHLTTRQTERLGLALKALCKKMEALRKTFGLDQDELNLNLGPLGNLM